jgi:hypothetical protein
MPRISERGQYFGGNMASIFREKVKVKEKNTSRSRLSKSPNYSGFLLAVIFDPVPSEILSVYEFYCGIFAKNKNCMAREIAVAIERL